MPQDVAFINDDVMKRPISQDHLASMREHQVESGDDVIWDSKPSGVACVDDRIKVQCQAARTSELDWDHGFESSVDDTPDHRLNLIS